MESAIAVAWAITHPDPGHNSWTAPRRAEVASAITNLEAFDGADAGANQGHVGGVKVRIIRKLRKHTVGEVAEAADSLWLKWKADSKCTSPAKRKAAGTAPSGGGGSAAKRMKASDSSATVAAAAAPTATSAPSRTAAAAASAVRRCTACHESFTKDNFFKKPWDAAARGEALGRCKVCHNAYTQRTQAAKNQPAVAARKLARATEAERVRELLQSAVRDKVAPTVCRFCRVPFDAQSFDESQWRMSHRAKCRQCQGMEEMEAAYFDPGSNPGVSNERMLARSERTFAREEALAAQPVPTRVEKWDHGMSEASHGWFLSSRAELCARAEDCDLPALGFGAGIPTERLPDGVSESATGTGRYTAFAWTFDCGCGQEVNFAERLLLREQPQLRVYPTRQLPDSQQAPRAGTQGDWPGMVSIEPSPEFGPGSDVHIVQGGPFQYERQRLRLAKRGVVAVNQCRLPCSGTWRDRAGGDSNGLAFGAFINGRTDCVLDECIAEVIGQLNGETTDVRLYQMDESGHRAGQYNGRWLPPGWWQPVDGKEMKSYRAAQLKCDGLDRYWCNRDAEDRRSIVVLLLCLQRKCTDSASRSDDELTRWLLMFGAVMRPPDNAMRLLKVSTVPQVA